MENKEEAEIAIDSEEEEVIAYHDYDIATYPSDYSLEMINELWQKEDIKIPDFQRNFVWTIKQSSLLIESFLLGLPVPQAFMYINKDNDSLLIDGQQRILSIVYYFSGYFGEENLQGKKTVFRLKGLDPKSPYCDKRFIDLKPEDQKKLSKATLRVVNVKQLSPKDDNTSIFHIFERLNTGGTPLKPQEIRNCVFHGPIVKKLNELNLDANWRKIISRPNPDKHQRDVEFILRVFAMSYNSKNYEKPMKEFLNKQMNEHRYDKHGTLSEFAARFLTITEYVANNFKEKPFHVRGPINLAALDSVMSTLINLKGKISDDIPAKFENLLANEGYQETIFYNTSDSVTVEERLKITANFLT
jgi:uncharacterized protein with ParB-like and HNH nuclease domain